MSHAAGVIEKTHSTSGKLLDFAEIMHSHDKRVIIWTIILTALEFDSYDGGSTIWALGPYELTF